MVVNADELIKQFTPEQKTQWYKEYKLYKDPRITVVGNFLRNHRITGESDISTEVMTFMDAVFYDLENVTAQWCKC